MGKCTSWFYSHSHNSFEVCRKGLFASYGDNEHAIDAEIRRQLSTHSTPPLGMDTPIHTTAQSSFSKEHVQAMVVNDDDKMVIFATLSANAPIEKQDLNSIATQSMQVMLISDDSVIMIDEELM
ncbi:hypothetical protein GOP47_0028896 [Adiantum capillus-veneris]|nr:hypothetical protein GOP47_0028896 [Adiantum capillus-veneris]